MSTETTPTDEMFEAFMMKVCEPDDWNAGKKAEIYVRSSNDSEWTQGPVEIGDPYEILPIAVAFASQEDQESMLLMYGWATKIPDDVNPDEFDEDMDDLERVRVRIMVHMTHDKERMAVQFQGKTIEEHTDFGTGSFPDAIRELRQMQKGRFL